MSTPIETNTEELQEILQTVYNLPLAGGGGSAELDLVINLTSTDGEMITDNLEKVSFDAASAINTYNKLVAGQSVNCVLNAELMPYDELWYMSSPHVYAFANRVGAEDFEGTMMLAFYLRIIGGTDLSVYECSVTIDFLTKETPEVMFLNCSRVYTIDSDDMA